LNLVIENPGVHGTAAHAPIARALARRCQARFPGGAAAGIVVPGPGRHGCPPPAARGRGGFGGWPRGQPTGVGLAARRG
jgi:hypothetical protein